LLGVAAAGVLAAQSGVPPTLETWHDFNLNLWKKGRFAFHMDAEWREYPEAGDLFRFRWGPIGEIRLNERASFVSGFMFHHLQLGLEEQPHANFLQKRFYNGLMYTVAEKSRVKVEGRTLLDRWMDGPVPDHFRYRQQVRISGTGRTAPYVYDEVFLDNHGFLSNRTGMGLRFEANAQFTVLCGYMYEARADRFGRNRHVIQTQIQFQRKGAE
jgi:hypothetical protein